MFVQAVAHVANVDGDGGFEHVLMTVTLVPDVAVAGLLLFVSATDVGQLPGAAVDEMCVVGSIVVVDAVVVLRSVAQVEVVGFVAVVAVDEYLLNDDFDAAHLVVDVHWVAVVDVEIDDDDH